MFLLVIFLYLFLFIYAVNGRLILLIKNEYLSIMGKRILVSSLMIMIFLILSPLTAYPATNCQNIQKIMQSAITKRDNDNIDLSTKKKRMHYIRQLSAELEDLKFCKKTIKDPFLKLQVNTVINTIEGKIKKISDLTDYKILKCQQCQSITECRELCDEIKKRKEYWRKRYNNAIQGHDSLDCEKCIKDLENYYITVEDLLSKEELNVNQIYSKESITALWGILYSISKNQECLHKGQEKLQRIMLPFLMPPSDLVKFISEKFKKLNEDEQKELLERKEDALFMIEFLIEVIRKTEPDFLYKLNIDPYILADMLSKIIGKYPRYADVALLLPLTIPTYKMVTIFKEQFEKLTEEEQKNFLERKEGATSLINFFIEIFRESDPHFFNNLNLNASDLATILLTMLEKDPEKIKELHHILPAGDLVSILSKRFEKLSEEEQKELLERKKDTLFLIKTFIKTFRETDPDISAKLGLTGDELADTLVNMIGEDPNEREKLSKKIFGEIPCKDLPFKYLASFMMPGYVRTYNEIKPSKKVRVWNWTNFTLIGVSIFAEALYVNDDYENDTAFWIGAGGTGLFLINGILGVLRLNIKF